MPSEIARFDSRGRGTLTSLTLGTQRYHTYRYSTVKQTYKGQGKVALWID